jgi:hypothetical protein
VCLGWLPVTAAKVWRFLRRKQRRILRECLQERGGGGVLLEGGAELRNLHRDGRGLGERPREVFLHQPDELLGLAAIQPHDRREVLLLLRGEVVNLAGHLPVDVPGVDYQHLVAPVLRLVAVEVPQLARYRPRVEEVVPDRDHHVHVAGLNDLSAHLGLAVPGARYLRRHHESGPPLGVQVAVEVGDHSRISVPHTE